MAANTEEGLQFHIEVQEGVEGADGEVIIIYNYDDAELTPELLAKTLEELSTQTSLRKSAANQAQLVGQGETVTINGLQGQDVIQVPNLGCQLDPELLLMPMIKVEGQDENGSTIQFPVTSDPSMEIELDKNQFPIETKFKVEVAEGEGLNDNITIEEVKEQEIVKNITGSGTPEQDGLADTPESNNALTEAINNLKVSFKREEESEDTDEEEKEQDYSCDKCNYVCRIEIELQRHKKEVHNEEEPFVCRHCSKAFKVELSLEVHKIAHSKKARSPFAKLKFDPGFIHRVMKFFTCPLCDFQYQRRSQCSTHMRALHKGKDYVRCPKCPYSCLTQEELDAHTSSPAHEEEQRTLCPLCGTATKDIRQHLKRTHNDDRPYLCNQCGFKAKTATNLSTHMITHDPIKRVACELCPYKCRTRDQLKRHLVKHSSEKNYSCTRCDFACKTSMSLKRHMQIHQAPNKYICAICHFTTHDKLILRKHKAEEHILKASHKCKQCDVEFERAVELKKHALAVHKSEKIHFCSYCDFSGQTVTELRIHMQSHFGKFPFTCSVCGYMCRLKASYRRHMERHSKIKKYACTLCSYACVEKYDLQKHYTHRHSDEKPLACPYCPYRCKFKPRLNNHIAYVHSDVKPFFCKQCPYTGKSAENLKKHMVNHGVVIKSLQCVLCDYATAEKAKLKRHMQVHVKKAIFR